MLDATTTISDFLTEAAAKRPTPGGGAVAALAGALAAAMGEMVLQYSLAKKSLAGHAGENGRVLAEMTRARAMLLEWMAEDQAVFEQLTEAKKRGDDTAALLDAAIAVPQAVGQTALVLLALAVRVAPTSNVFLSSDLAVCGELATATVRSAVHNIRANLANASDSRRDELELDCRRMVSEAVGHVRRLTDAISLAKGLA